jgi:hypothetical protein
MPSPSSSPRASTTFRLRGGALVITIGSSRTEVGEPATAWNSLAMRIFSLTGVAWEGSPCTVGRGYEAASASSRLITRARRAASALLRSAANSLAYVPTAAAANLGSPSVTERSTKVDPSSGVKLSRPSSPGAVSSSPAPMSLSFLSCLTTRSATTTFLSTSGEAPADSSPATSPTTGGIRTMASTGDWSTCMRTVASYVDPRLRTLGRANQPRANPSTSPSTSSSF